MSYVEPRRARHRVQMTPRGEQLRIPMRRNIFAILFLPPWLVGWAWGESFAVRELMERPDTFLIAWLCAWTVGGAAAILSLLSALGGSEVLRVENGDLVASIGVGPLRRTWRYRGGEISNLMGWFPERDFWNGWNRLDRPLWRRARTGAVKFDYGSESIFVARDVDEPEGAEIAEWLGRRLPRGATE